MSMPPHFPQENKYFLDKIIQIFYYLSKLGYVYVYFINNLHFVIHFNDFTNLLKINIILLWNYLM